MKDNCEGCEKGYLTILAIKAIFDLLLLSICMGLLQLKPFLSIRATLTFNSALKCEMHLAPSHCWGHLTQFHRGGKDPPEVSGSPIPIDFGLFTYCVKPIATTRPDHLSNPTPGPPGVNFAFCLEIDFDEDRG